MNRGSAWDCFAVGMVEGRDWKEDRKHRGNGGHSRGIQVVRPGRQAEQECGRAGCLGDSDKGQRVERIGAVGPDPLHVPHSQKGQNRECFPSPSPVPILTIPIHILQLIRLLLHKRKHVCKHEERVLDTNQKHPPQTKSEGAQPKKQGK